MRFRQRANSYLVSGTVLLCLKFLNLIKKIHSRQFRILSISTSVLQQCLFFVLLSVLW